MNTRKRVSRWQLLPMLWSLYRDKRTPKIVKILPIIALLYGISPLDFIPDFLPLVGQADDLLIIITFLLGAFKLIPKDLYREHRERVKVTPE